LTPRTYNLLEPAFNIFHGNLQPPGGNHENTGAEFPPGIWNRQYWLPTGDMNRFANWQDTEEPGIATLHREGLGVTLSVMQAKESQHMRLFLIRTSSKIIVITCFTFDLEEVVDALIAAVVRGVPDVIVLADKRHTYGGITVNQSRRIWRLRDNGVIVGLCTGTDVGLSYSEHQRQVRPGLTGIQHSKTLLADEFLVHGSCNWTTSSRANNEIDTLVHLNPDGISRMMLIYSAMQQNGERLNSMTADDYQAARDAVHTKQPSRARSVPAKEPSKVAKPQPNADFYRTAKRWSLSQERNQKDTHSTSGRDEPPTSRASARAAATRVAGDSLIP